MKPVYRDVKSSNIKRMAFVQNSFGKTDTGILYVEFPRLVRFAYSGVTLKEFGELKGAKSIGSHYAKNIKGQKPVYWAGHRCGASPCDEDATLQAEVAGLKIYVCATCSKTQPQLAGIEFTTIPETR